MATKKRKSDAMSGADFQSLVTEVFDAGIEFVDGSLADDRAEATDYYNAEKFGNEEDGRSQVVLSEVRDTVNGLLPSLLRPIFGPDGVVEFVPRKAEDVEKARQATDFVQYIFEEENAGFLAAHSVLKDGMLKKLGIFKWGYDEKAGMKAGAIEGVSDEDIAALEAVEGFTLTRAVAAGEGLSDIEFTVAAPEGKPWVKAVPPEEFLFTPQARDRDTALFLGHRQNLSKGELRALGVPEKMIEEAQALMTGDDLGDSLEDIARREAGAGTADDDPEAGDANEKILYIEGYLRADFDGDGIAELRKVCTVGPKHTVWHNRPTNHVPFSFFTPDPEPHAILGSSTADRTMDIQLVKSSLLRGALDSLSASLFPRVEYVEGEVSVEDLLNTEIGAPIRVTRPGMTNQQKVNFTGEAAFLFLEYFDSVKEQRTGHSKGAMGLDADALQSSTKTAVNAAVSGAQEQKELIVRVFAEMALKPMFRGLYRLIMEHQPKQTVAKLRGTWVEVDPSQWDPNMDVRVTVALGSGLTEEKIATLTSLYEAQMGILQTGGFSNPLVTPWHLRNTIADILRLRGRPDVDRYIAPVDKNWQPPQPETPPSDAQIAAAAMREVEQIKMLKEFAIKEEEIAIKREELALKQREAEMAHEREREKLSMEATLKRYELQLKFQADISKAKLAADQKAQEMALEKDRLDQEALKHEDEIEMREQEQRHEQETSAREQDRADVEVQQAKKKASE